MVVSAVSEELFVLPDVQDILRSDYLRKVF